MMVRRFARPYAKAITDVAGGAAKAAPVRDELARFDEVRRSSVELQEVFANPGIELDAKVAIANRIADRLQFSPFGRKAIEVLIRNHRANDLPAIVDAVTAFVNEATNTVIAEVRSAAPLAADEQADLTQTLERKFGKRVDIRVTTDPALLGGFVARIGSEIYDASVAGKIDKFRESLA